MGSGCRAREGVLRGRLGWGLGLIGGATAGVTRRQFRHPLPPKLGGTRGRMGPNLGMVIRTPGRPTWAVGRVTVCPISVGRVDLFPCFSCRMHTVP